MIIEVVYLFSGLLFMALCWVVAKRQVSRPIRLRERDGNFINRYLFSPASFSEATSGVVGSTISFYITIFSTFCLSFGWGSILVCVLVPSIALSFLFFYLLVARVITERFAHLDAMRRRTADESVTFMDYLLRRHDSWFGAWFCVALMLLYISSTVATEMGSLQILYAHIAKSPVELLVAKSAAGAASLDSRYKFGLAILLCSLGYVLRGGYPGIMKIDRIQVVLISLTSFAALLWIVFFMHPFALVRSQFVFDRHVAEMVSLGIAAFLLVATWIPAALDNWLRVGGSMVDRIKEISWARSIDETKTFARASLRRSMIVAALLAMLISTVPSLLGLVLRQRAIEIWEAAPHTVDACADAAPAPQTVTAPVSGFLERYVSQNVVLVPSACGDWIAPDTRDPKRLSQFAVFTSSMYDFFSLFLADQWVEYVEQGAGWAPIGWLLVSAILAVSVICAVITTVNSYLLCTSQLVHRLVFLDPLRRIHLADAADPPVGSRTATILRAAADRLIQPLGSTLLVALPIAYLVQSNSLTEGNYISYGILAFSNIIYLAVIGAIAVLGKDAARVRRCVAWLAASWVLVIGLWIVHMYAEQGLLPWGLQDSFVGTQLAPRTTVVQVAGAANILVWAFNYPPPLARAARRLLARWRGRR
jgi:hypothetical protein